MATLHHNGKPVLFAWGFFSDRFSGAVANQLIDALRSQDRYSVTLIGGVPWYWRKENDPAWANAFRRFDVICPWNVGNYRTEQDIKHAAKVSNTPPIQAKFSDLEGLPSDWYLRLTRDEPIPAKHKR